ncbi:DUF975 family protein [Lacticaseibacillus sharpeae]|uniref:Integral membrane protein n=1 Tax=Lacticaseibacillus sharpeae JCM 1186 = DSM 20505 TaxID=1291052 RepID=A0A0R1ZK58_9LACO|nr:DUF975 family protein [Lacticaseibacillus sharpeae]KRM55328.1 hypothetical protein FC18_GL001496 [Lacticaseibacillus sharpeae JCM 1186 = DSM 20505]
MVAISKKKKRTYGDFDATFKTRRQLKRIAWARTREPHIYWRLALIGLLPIIIEGVFVGLSVVAGMSKGISLHHIEQFYKFSRQFNDSMGWTALTELVVGIFGQILVYAALLVIRKHNYQLEVGPTVWQHLSWRYVLPYLFVQLIQGLLMAAFFIVFLILAVMAIMLWQVLPAAAIGVGLIALLLMLLPLYLSLGWSQTGYLIKEAVEADDNPRLFRVLGDSWRMMRGFKFDLLVLYLSMFWWYVLTVCTLFIGYIFIQPYFALTRAAFHENVRRFDEQRRAVGM